MAKVFTVISGKGGVGKSTFCANVAQALSEYGKTVLLIDGDVALRSLDLLLGLDENLVYDWSDVFYGRCNKESALLRYNENLSLLPAPLEMPRDMTAEDFKNIVDYYSVYYDYIFIDSPAGIGDLPMIYANASDECIVIATPDNVSARGAYAIGNALINYGKSDENIRLIINRFNEKAVKRGRFLNIDEIVDITYMRLLGVVPEEELLMYSSVNKKKLSPYNSTKIAFKNIAGRIIGKEIPLYL